MKDSFFAEAVELWNSLVPPSDLTKNRSIKSKNENFKPNYDEFDRPQASLESTSSIQPDGWS